MWNLIANLVFSFFLFIFSLPIVALIRYLARRKGNHASKEKIEFLPIHSKAGWAIFISTTAIVLIFSSAVFVYNNYPCEFFFDQGKYNFLVSTKNGAYLLLPLIYTALVVRMLYIYFRKFSFSSAHLIDRAFFSLGVISYFLLLMLVSSGLRYAMQSGGGCMGL